MIIVNMAVAKKHLSHLVELAAGGTDVVICRRDAPVARITRLTSNKRPITFGLLAGKIRFKDNTNTI